MADEKRLIEANLYNEVIDFTSKHLVIGDSEFLNGYVAALKATKNVIAELPAVDALEVVRCKSCKHWADGVAGCTEHVKCCKIGFYMIGEDGYCSFGERK